MKRKPLIAGNWKMNGSRQQVESFASDVNHADLYLDCDLLVCVPCVYLDAMSRALSGSRMAVGAQDVARQAEAGAVTGEVNGAMLTDVGCSHVIVGHSERRASYGESDEVVVAKLNAAAAAGLLPIVCVGETLEERDAGQAESVLTKQIGAVLDACDDDLLKNLTVAYEPVWAIGTGRSATPEQAQAMHAFIRTQIAARDDILADSMRLLYGGSVKPENASSLFAGEDVDGALVGGASLKAESLLDIARAA